MKSTVEEIRRRFDADVERFSNLEIGQSAMVDSPLSMELVAQAASATTPHDRHVLHRKLQPELSRVLLRSVCAGRTAAGEDPGAGKRPGSYLK
jgi:hypothetical protein